MHPNSGWQTNQQYPSENEQQHQNNGEWSGIRPEQRAYNRNHGFSPFTGGTNGGWLEMTPVQAAKYQLKRAIKKLLPAMLIFLVAEYAALYAISYLIDLALSQQIMLSMTSGLQFPQGTYFGMRNGLYTLLTGYLPVVIGELAAILYLFGITRIPFGKLFCRPQLPMRRSQDNAPPSKIGQAGWILFAALAGIGFSMIGQLLAMIELNLLYTINFPFYTPSFSTDGYNILDTVLVNLYVCVLGPVLEEVIFRGFLLKGLQRFGVSFAAVFTALLFTLYHMNLVQLFVPLIMGLFLAQLTIRTGSLIPAICCHILNNSFATLADMIMPASDIWSWVFLIVESAIFIGILGIFWVFYGREFSPILKWRHPVLKLSAQVGTAMTTWPCILLMVVYVGTILASSLMTMIGY